MIRDRDAVTPEREDLVPTGVPKRHEFDPGAESGSTELLQEITPFHKSKSIH